MPTTNFGRARTNLGRAAGRVLLIDLPEDVSLLRGACPARFREREGVRYKERMEERTTSQQPVT